MSRIHRNEYFVLTKEVANPHPDRRSKGFIDRTSWAKGTKIQRRTIIELNKPEQVEYRGFRSGAALDEVQVNAIKDCLEPAPKAIGQFMDSEGVAAEAVLAMLIHQGIVRLDTVERLCRDISYMDDDDQVAFEKSHWL
jgi:transketolase N-terminal domain/subunit